MSGRSSASSSHQRDHQKAAARKRARSPSPSVASASSSSAASASAATAAAPQTPQRKRPKQDANGGSGSSHASKRVGGGSGSSAAPGVKRAKGEAGASSTSSSSATAPLSPASAAALAAKRVAAATKKLANYCYSPVRAPQPPPAAIITAPSACRSGKKIRRSPSPQPLPSPAASSPASSPAPPSRSLRATEEGATQEKKVPLSAKEKTRLMVARRQATIAAKMAAAEAAEAAEQDGSTVPASAPAFAPAPAPAAVAPPASSKKASAVAASSSASKGGDSGPASSSNASAARALSVMSPPGTIQTPSFRIVDMAKVQRVLAQFADTSGNKDLPPLEDMSDRAFIKRHRALEQDEAQIREEERRDSIVRWAICDAPSCRKWRVLAKNCTIPSDPEVHWFCGGITSRAGGKPQPRHCAKRDDWIEKCVGARLAKELEAAGITTVALLESKEKGQPPAHYATYCQRMRALGVYYDTHTQTICKY